MDAARYQQVKAIFHAAVELPPAERASLVRERCGADTELARQVDQLLTSHANAPEFLETPAMKIKASDLVQEAPSSPGAATQVPPKTVGIRTGNPEDDKAVGPYRLLEVLGEGGMGTVYKAEQVTPVRRLVALKLIKLGMDTKEVIARFEAERQALAMMDHPCIAKVLDAGATATGRPYFVMEYVPGVPINEHCDRHNLNTAQRLRLFLDVCDAVHHAHQRAVIHRDLKPSNILVMFQNERAVPKVIDFGIAKATNHHLTERTVFTEQGRIIGTPEYMSPEQAEMTEQGVDTRTDVYSLGVILYELLAGVLPFTSQELRAQGYAGLQRTIREIEPPRPSTRITTLGAQSPGKIAQSRSTDLRSLVRQLRGDLDWIVMKAIAKSRTERYESAFGIGEDIRRFLAHEPVLATRPSLSYRFAKFVRRNRIAVGTTAAIIVALGTGLVFAVLAYQEVARKKTELDSALTTAQTEKTRAEAKEREATENAARAMESEKRAKESEQRAKDNEQKAKDSEARATAALAEAGSSAARAAASQTREEKTAREKVEQVEENEALVAQAIFNELSATAADLWPARPELAAGIGEWLSRFESIAARRAKLEEVRARIRGRAAPYGAADTESDRASHPRWPELQAIEKKLAEVGLAEPDRAKLMAQRNQLAAEVAVRRTWKFQDSDLAMKHAVISRLLDGLAKVTGDGGLAAQMRWRLDQANSLRARTVDAHAEAWQTTAAAAAKIPAYTRADRPIVLAPQTGLVPLGPDPASGLLEFAHLQTGAAPERGADGKLAFKPECGLVLVLLPGGTLRMGASREGDNADPAALSHEGPAHSVELAPFFAAKFEMTQGQWERWTKTNPSYYRAGQTILDTHLIDGTNPVETVTWQEATDVLRQLDLELPTEAQWEWLARGGRTTIYFAGNSPADLKGSINFAAADSPPDWVPEQSFEDGFPVHASAFAVAPNPFGLHHVLGNVSEWCRDTYGSYSSPTRNGDGLRSVEPSLQRIHRGGSYRSNAGKCRVTAREADPGDARSESRGLRPIRRLELDDHR
jgi:serine/threonine protein kinase/formylglycine-generating enzyme required for sulfatase activity